MSALLAVTTLFSLMACENIYDQVAATATQQNEDKSSTKKPVIVTDDDGGFIIETEEDESNTEKNSSTTRKPSTTRPTTTKPTTTKKKVIEKIPSTVAEVLSEYNKAANRTKAAKNMTVDKTNKVIIVIDEFLGSEALATPATNLAKSFMKQYDGTDVINEVYVDGKPTKNTTEYDLQYTNILCNDKRIFLPVRNKNYMCNLSPSDVVSAKATRLSESTYKVVIVLKSESTDLNTPPQIITRGMDYFEQKVFDLGVFEFVAGTAKYENCVITGIVNAEGYLDYAENKMSVSSTDAKVTKLEIDAKLHGDYTTTFSFSNIK
ncbi:MAG: hypothetical protein IJD88_01600, partial [Clostridia bacterium]|nr:hypothetical protein [Clostridia bacterium]